MGKNNKNKTQKDAQNAAIAAGKEVATQMVKHFKPLQSLGQFGGPMAQSLGKMADSKLVRLIGKGTYMVGRGSYDISPDADAIHNDTFKDVEKRFNVKGFKNDDNGKIVLFGTELVTVVVSTGSAADSCISFQVNPGLRACFPFASQLVTNFAEFEMLQLVYEYQPVVSKTSVSSVGSLGNVVMGVNYNAGAEKFTSFPQIMNSEHSVRGTIADKIFCGIECDPTKNANRSYLYVRSGQVPTGQDIKTYDLAKFQLMLSGVPTQYVAGTTLGNLVVHYGVAVSKKVFFDGMGYNILMDQFWSQTGATLTYLVPLGTAPYKNKNNSIGCSVSVVSGVQRMTFPDDFVGLVEVAAFAVGSGFNSGMILTAFGAVVAQTELISSTNTNTAALSYTNGTNTSFLGYFNVVSAASTTGANYITIQSNGTAVTTLTSFTMEVQLSNGLFNNPVNSGVLA